MEERLYIRLAVSAPRGVELDQNILGIIHDNLLVVVGDHNGDGAIIGLGNGLGLDAGLDLSGKDILDELGDFSGHEGLGLVIRVLLVGSGIVKSESRELLGIKVEVASMGTEGLGIDGRNVDLALELLSEGLEVGGVLVTLLLGLGEDVGKRNSGLVRVGFVSTRIYGQIGKKEKKMQTYRHVSGIRVRTDNANKRGAGGLDEVSQGVSVELLLEDGLLLIKVLVKDDGGLFDTLCLGQSSVIGATEQIFVPELFRDLAKGFIGLVIGGHVGDHDNLVEGLEFLNTLSSDWGNCGERLFDHKGYDAEKKKPL
jgi:hypothetical protein